MNDALPGRLTVAEGSRATLTALVRAMLGISHRAARDAIEAGTVLVDDRVASDPVSRPPGGSCVRVDPRRAGSAPRPRRRIEGPGFRTVFIDADLVVVDKDPGIVTIPVSGAEDDGTDPSLVGLVAAALRSAGHRARELFVVHRIDRETSGLVVIARTKPAFERLREQFRVRSAVREYLAWCESAPVPAAGTLTHRLAEEDDSHRMRVVGDDRPGQRAELTYAVEAAGANGARLAVRLVTGRRNQIRVQLAARGCPILGDRYYGASAEGIGRAALHALRLVVRHPRQGRELDLVAPVPDDLRALDRRMFPPRLRVMR